MGLYFSPSGISSSFSLVSLGRIKDLRFLASGLVTDRIVALPSSSSTDAMRGIAGGSRDGAGSFHTTWATLAAFARSASLFARAFSSQMGVGMGSSIPLIYTSFLFFPFPGTS